MHAERECFNLLKPTRLRSFECSSMIAVCLGAPGVEDCIHDRGLQRMQAGSWHEGNNNNIYIG